MQLQIFTLNVSLRLPMANYSPHVAATACLTFHNALPAVFTAFKDLVQHEGH